jgi:3-methylcrotonyl-CoA carboxylase alpha subunit
MTPPKVELIATRDNIAEMRIDGRTVFVPYIVQGAQVSFKYEGETYSVDAAEKTSRARRRHRDQTTSAPMPGVILKVLVSKGEQVTKGAPLVILEAMKMEHVISAPRDGTVNAINCREGELVQPGFDLIGLTVNG